MQLDDAQKQQVVAWLGEGLKLAEIQTRLEGEFGVRLTYLEVKMLVSELEVLPHDPDPEPTPPPAAPASPLSAAGQGAGPGPGPGPARPARPPGEPPPGPAPRPEPAPAGGGVSVSVDQLARPGALVSGKVTFSDGQTGSWYVDEMGRLGLAPTQQGYRPTTADMQTFQRKLEGELSRQGM